LLSAYLRELEVSRDRLAKHIGEAPNVLALFEETLEVV